MVGVWKGYCKLGDHIYDETLLKERIQQINDTILEKSNSRSSAAAAEVAFATSAIGVCEKVAIMMEQWDGDLEKALEDRNEESARLRGV